MRKKLIDDIKTSLEEDNGGHVIKLSFVLRTREAKAFLQIHQELGGTAVISANDLAARIVSHSLQRHEAGRAASKGIGHE